VNDLQGEFSRNVISLLYKLGLHNKRLDFLSLSPKNEKSRLLIISFEKRKKGVGLKL